MSSAPTRDEFLSAIAKIEKLAPAPRTLGRALQLLRDPDSALHNIAKLISCDSALAVEVLRCANSAFYSRTAPTADVGEALQVIGFGETVRLVTLVAGHQTTSRNLGSYGIGAGDFWAESLFNGLLLERLANHVGVMDSGEAYTAGLLRFVGRLAIDQVLFESGGNLFWDGHTPLAQWERENVGLTQSEVAGRLLRKWELPEHMVLAIEIQDVPEIDASADMHPLIQCVHFASRLLPAGTDLTGIEAIVANPPEVPKDHPLVVANNVDAATLATLLKSTHEAFVSINETLYA